MERMNEYVREMSYRIYVTDALKSIAENTKFHVASQGMVEHGFSMSARWVDGIFGSNEEPEDDRPCEEIAADIWKRAGIGENNERF